MEEQIKGLRQEMEQEEIVTDYMKLKELQDEIQRLEGEIELKMLEWETLNEE